MNKVNSDIEKKSYVGSKQAYVCVGGETERDKERGRDTERETERDTEEEREDLLGWVGKASVRRGLGQVRLGHEQ